MTIITLKNGIEIVLSDNKNNTTGYTGVSFSPAWTLDENNPFIPFVNNPDARDNGTTHSIHLGKYPDSREAAYVVALYHKDPEKTRQHITNDKYISFPPDLYELPVTISLSKAKVLIHAKRGASVDFGAIPAKNNLLTYFNRNDIVSIANAKGGADKFQAFIADMTIQSFANEFNLVFK